MMRECEAESFWCQKDPSDHDRGRKSQMHLTDQDISLALSALYICFSCHSCLSGYPFIFSNSHHHTHSALHLSQEVTKTETALSKHKSYLRFLPTENETFDTSSFESLHKKDGVSWIHFIISFHCLSVAVSPQSSDANVALSRLSISFWLSLKLKMSILACTWANIASWFLMVPKAPLWHRWVLESFAPLVRAFKCSGFADFVATETLCVTIHFKATCHCMDQNMESC